MNLMLDQWEAQPVPIRRPIERLTHEHFPLGRSPDSVATRGAQRVCLAVVTDAVDFCLDRPIAKADWPEIEIDDSEEALQQL